MCPITCFVCQLRLGMADDLGIDDLILEVHQRIYHPDVLPWACATCAYVPPGVEGVRCTNIQDGVSCMMYRPRPAWLRI
jgi:hypothetical protein